MSVTSWLRHGAFCLFLRLDHKKDLKTFLKASMSWSSGVLIISLFLRGWTLYIRSPHHSANGSTILSFIRQSSRCYGLYSVSGESRGINTTNGSEWFQVSHQVSRTIKTWRYQWTHQYSLDPRNQDSSSSPPPLCSTRRSSRWWEASDWPSWCSTCRDTETASCSQLVQLTLGCY